MFCWETPKLVLLKREMVTVSDLQHTNETLHIISIFCQ